MRAPATTSTVSDSATLVRPNAARLVSVPPKGSGLDGTPANE